MAEANQISVADDLSKEITDLGQKIKDLPFGARVKKKYYPVRSAEELTCSAEELDTPYLISREYLDKFGYAGPAKDSGKKLLFLGMNPGAGAVETGVPFGEKELVKKQLKIVCENVGPWTFTGGNKESARLWELLLELFNNDVQALINSRLVFVYNYCPVMLCGSRGGNVSLNDPKIPKKDRVADCPLQTECDKTLLKVVELLGVTDIVAVGTYAERAAERAVKRSEKPTVNEVEVHYLVHPSPRNFNFAGEKWKIRAEDTLAEAGLLACFPPRRSDLADKLRQDMTKLPQDVYEVVRCQQQIKGMLTMLVQSKDAPKQESETVYLALPVEKWEELVELQKELSNVTLTSRTQEQSTNAVLQKIEQEVREGRVKKEEKRNCSLM